MKVSNFLSIGLLVSRTDLTASKKVEDRVSDGPAAGPLNRHHRLARCLHIFKPLDDNVRVHEKRALPTKDVPIMPETNHCLCL